MNMYLQLFLTYAKIGAITFGGGYAMLPILKRELVQKKGWVTEDDLIDCYAIGQCTPGVIAVNAATLIGYQKKGFWGAFCATTGVVTPPVLIIISVASIISAFSSNIYVQHALRGMNVAICAVIALTVLGLIKKTWKDLYCIIIGLVVFALTVAFDIPTVLAVLGAAVVGVVICNIKKDKQLKRERKQKMHSHEKPRKGSGRRSRVEGGEDK